jgi:hypothetical protein
MLGLFLPHGSQETLEHVYREMVVSQSLVATRLPGHGLSLQKRRLSVE